MCPAYVSYLCILPVGPACLSCLCVLPVYSACWSCLSVLPSCPTCAFCWYVLPLWFTYCLYLFVLRILMFFLCDSLVCPDFMRYLHTCRAHVFCYVPFAYVLPMYPAVFPAYVSCFCVLHMSHTCMSCLRVLLVSRQCVLLTSCQPACVSCLSVLPIYSAYLSCLPVFPVFPRPACMVCPPCLLILTCSSLHCFSYV